MKKLKNKELTKYYFVTNHPNIGYALLLCFGEEKYPIRPKMYYEYFEIIDNLYNATEKNNIFYCSPKQE